MKTKSVNEQCNVYHMSWYTITEYFSQFSLEICQKADEIPNLDAEIQVLMFFFEIWSQKGFIRRYCSFIYLFIYFLLSFGFPANDYKPFNSSLKS